MSPPPSRKPDDRVLLLAAAGLLHDVGKVFEPARAELSEQINRMEHLICPSDRRGGYTHRHALHTAQAINEAETDFGGIDKDALFRVASYHHRPSAERFDEHLLQKADWLASGHDRTPGGADEGPVTGMTAPAGLMHVRDHSAQPSPSNGQLPTRSLSFEPDAFLPREPQDRSAYVQRCRALTEELREGLRTPFASASECVEGLAALLGRAAHAVPASRARGERADVSLYDHSRVVAAFASCLAVQHSDGPCDAMRLEGRYRLVDLELGGIQGFISRDVPPLGPPDEPRHKDRAKRLRARSFYVSLLSHLAARRIVEAVGLPSVNIVVEAGDRATILLPETAEMRDALDGAVDWIRSWLLRELGGSVRIDIAVSRALTDEDFKRDKFGETRREASAGLRDARLAPPPSDLRTVDGWAERGWVAETPDLPVDRADFKDRIRMLGEALPKAQWMTLDEGDGLLRSQPMSILGYNVQLHEQRPKGKRCWTLSAGGEANSGRDRNIATPAFLAANHVPTATREDLEHAASEAADLPNQAGDDAPSEIGQTLTFNYLAPLSVDDQGQPAPHPMLGVLQADVDRLGLVFGYGLGEDASLGRLASLSRGLDLFFKGFLMDRLRQRYPRVYTVYSGGDDLFLVGPWLDMARLARDLRGWFERHTCGNRDLTLSAGLVFAKPHAPVGHLAKQASDALDAAKDRGRNKVVVGRRAISWPALRQAIELHETLHTARQRDVLAGSLVYRLMRYGNAACASQEGDPPNATDLNLKWRSQMAYDLRRNLDLDRSDRDPEDQRLVEAIHRICASSQNADSAAALWLGAMLALYRVRGES